MSGIIKFMIRLVIISGITLVGATLIAGPDRMHVLFSKVQDRVGSVIDDNIDDPAAMRSQLRQLEKQYPERIAQVRGDLGELHEQIRQLEKEKAVAERVVDLTGDDLTELQGKIESTGSEQTSATPASSATMRRNVAPIDVQRAYVRMNNISQTRAAYAARATDAERDLGYLYQQQERLEQLLAKLETERSQFQAQIWQLDRQVDAMARNERLIGMMEKRQETINELGRYRVNSLDQLQAKLGEIRARQEATLQVLATSEQQCSYEDQAKMELDYEKSEGNCDWKAEVRMAIPDGAMPANF